MGDLQKLHWEKVYGTKKSKEISWTQLVPQTSLNFIHSYHLPKTASIIDVGGGDSNLVDHLLDEGFTNLTVLDISARALDNAKQRLGARERSVKGYMIIATFSEVGPEKCSGLDVQQYSDEKLETIFNNRFLKLHCITEDHITPFNTTQNFLFCSFKKRNI